ncbi:MAG: C39 family peptidase [Candidatus Magasanikbacteria bacterium]
MDALWVSFITVIITVIFISLIPSPTTASTKIQNISVPFTSQAPYAYWGQPWQDACEETAIVMIDNFYRGKTLETKAITKEEILKILNIKNKNFGTSLDENAEQITKLINDFLPWEARIVENPTLEQIKSEIDNSRPIIIPVHGKYLYNPHFRNGGPDYHVLVISGYDDETSEFITQEPGTRYGKNFRYKFDILLNAIHNFLPSLETKNGHKLAIFTQRELITSREADGDKDGLIKADELKYGTITWLYDSDGDGYKDGVEVISGYSPTTAEINLKNGSLIKSINDPKVYLLENKNKRHILNEQVFLKHGWQWNQIKIVSEKFLESLAIGKLIDE